MTDALVQFLRARLDEDEQIARGHQQWSAGWDQDDMAKEIRDDVNAGTVAFVPHLGDRTHITRHDPARVLAEVDAKRRIIALHSDPTGHSCSITDETGYELNYAEVARDEACTTLRLLALPWADHPAYQSEWAPDLA
ncbi:DUF6221 family protein [Streptomyces sp. NPDC001389]|uniref:DUF6221 family protein n=1 Tax=Streptomyces sp. NPDC001389 TaxID=3364569 RepID=UPI0036C00536